MCLSLQEREKARGLTEIGERDFSRQRSDWPTQTLAICLPSNSLDSHFLQGTYQTHRVRNQKDLGVWSPWREDGRTQFQRRALARKQASLSPLRYCFDARKTPDSAANDRAPVRQRSTNFGLCDKIDISDKLQHPADSHPRANLRHRRVRSSRGWFCGDYLLGCLIGRSSLSIGPSCSAVRPQNRMERHDKGFLWPLFTNFEQGQLVGQRDQ